MPAAFLHQQMAWREALDDAHTVDEVDALVQQVTDHRRAALMQLEATLDHEHDYAAAAQQVRALMFVERFAHDIDARLEALGQ
jgi:molecular chaperone HscB